MGRLITLTELAHRTGTCEQTWRYKIKTGELPVIRIGRSVRVAEAVVDQIIREGTHGKQLSGQVA